MAASVTKCGKQEPALTLKRNQDGLSWQITLVTTEYQQHPDYQKIEDWAYYEGITFTATPQTSIYPWKAPEETKARNLSFTLRKQRSRKFKQNLRYDMKPMIDQLERRSRGSTWGKPHWNKLQNKYGTSEASSRTTKTGQSIGSHLGNLISFTTAGHSTVNVRKLVDCNKETVVHIIWQCAKAQAAWKGWMDKWLGYPTTPSERAKLHRALALRTAPPPTTHFMAAAQNCTARWTAQHDSAMVTIWLIWSTVTPALLWRLRNRTVFEGLETSVEEAQNIIWAAGIYQVKAIASSWKARSATRIQGYCLEVCLAILVTINMNMEVTELERWLIRLYTGTLQEHQQVGAWMSYRFNEDSEWILQEAGNLRFAPQGTRNDNAELVLIEGLAAVTRKTDPSKILLSVERMEAAVPLYKRRSNKGTRSTPSTTSPCAKELSRFFGVQWGKPKLTELRASKQLAYDNTITKYEFQNRATAKPMNTMRSYLDKEAKRIMHQAPRAIGQTNRRKADSIQDRLIAYQASICTKT